MCLLCISWMCPHIHSWGLHFLHVMMEYSSFISQAFSQNFEKQLLASSCLSVCLHGTTQLQLDWFSWNLIWVFFQNLSRKFKFHLNLTWLSGTLNWNVCIFLMSCSNPHTMRNVSDISCREYQNTHFMFNNLSPRIVLLMRSCKSYGTAYRWQYGAALCMLHN